MQRMFGHHSFKLFKFPKFLHKTLVPNYYLQNVGTLGKLETLEQMMPNDSLQNIGKVGQLGKLETH